MNGPSQLSNGKKIVGKKKEKNEKERQHQREGANENIQETNENFSGLENQILINCYYTLRTNVTFDMDPTWTIFGVEKTAYSGNKNNAGLGLW